MKTLTLFFAHSFADQKVDDTGYPSDHGISDLELAAKIREWILQASGGQIDIHVTHDPLDGYISGRVRTELRSADLFLCLFTKRVKDDLTKLWLSSTYVMSEAAGAYCQFSSEMETHQRLFGLVEKGVDRTQLGMAFPSDKAVPEFRRSDLEGLHRQILSIVRQVLETPAPRTREYLRVDKSAYICRAGRVVVKCRHQFRFTKATRHVRIPHTMWRISQALPAGDTIWCHPVHCGDREPSTLRCQVEFKPCDRTDRERMFEVVIPDANLQPGQELAYEVAWTYADAFHGPQTAHPDEPDSVGLRTGDRGPAQIATLTLYFERPWDVGEPGMILEGPPELSTTDATHLPASYDALDFWHRGPGWTHRNAMSRWTGGSDSLFQAYQWRTESFVGMAKATFNAYPNYFVKASKSSRAISAFFGMDANGIPRLDR